MLMRCLVLKIWGYEFSVIAKVYCSSSLLTQRSALPCFRPIIMIIIVCSVQIRTRMERAIDDLWTGMKETYGKRKEWRDYFEGDNNKGEISETFTDRETWTVWSRNFLLRLIDDDKKYNSYLDEGYTPRPRVQLALNFVEHMAKNSEFSEFLRMTLSVERPPESASTETVQHEQPADQPQNGQQHVAMPAASETQEPEVVETGHGIELPEMSAQKTAVEHELPIDQPENGSTALLMPDDSDIEPVLDGNHEATDPSMTETGHDPELTFRPTVVEQNTEALQSDSDIEKERRNLIIHEAAKTGRCAVLKEFLTKENVNIKNNIGETALHLAAEFEHPDDVQILLDKGATVCVLIIL